MIVARCCVIWVISIIDCCHNLSSPPWPVSWSFLCSSPPPPTTTHYGRSFLERTFLDINLRLRFVDFPDCRPSLDVGEVIIRDSFCECVCVCVCCACHFSRSICWFLFFSSRHFSLHLHQWASSFRAQEEKRLLPCQLTVSKTEVAEEREYLSPWHKHRRHFRKTLSL